MPSSGPSHPEFNSPSPEQVRARAYERFISRAGRPGTPESDWLEAEAELSREHSPRRDEPARDLVEQESFDSFPASDPPSYGGATAGGRPPTRSKEPGREHDWLD